MVTWPIIGKTDFSECFRKIVTSYKKIGNNKNLCSKLHAWLLNRL